MANPRVLLGFTSMSDHEVEETAGAVIAGLYANPAIYATPPVTRRSCRPSSQRSPTPSPPKPKAATAAEEPEF